MQRLKRLFGKVRGLWKMADRTQTRAMLKNMTALAVMILITVSSMISVMASTRVAHVTVDGVSRDVEITSEATDKILLKAGFQLGSDDEVSRKNGEDDSRDVFITVKTAVDMQVEADGENRTVKVHYGDTVAQILQNTGIVTDSDDQVTPSLDKQVAESGKIRVVRRYSIEVTADGETVQATVSEGTIARALSQAGISLGAEDKVSADLNSPVGQDSDLTVTRVTYQETNSTQEIPFSTETKKTADLNVGTTKVKTKGQNGLKTVVTRQTMEDGKVVAEEVLSETVTQEPVNQVTLVGTKKKASGIASVGADGTLIDQNGNTVSYKKVITGRASCYTGGGWTSTGKKAAFGLVAVNPNLIPYGTRLYICSPDGKLVYGYATAADTGGAAMRGTIIADLYYDSYNECIKIGTRTMNVYVL